jgi:hypothetical protein
MNTILERSNNIFYERSWVFGLLVSLIGDKQPGNAYDIVHNNIIMYYYRRVTTAVKYFNTVFSSNTLAH